MQKIYLDCDGVILDTINRSYQMLKEEGIIGEENVRNFYSNICWRTLIKESGQIDNSIEKIKTLTKHFDIEILTHVNSENEAKVKIEYFAKELPDVNVITVPKIINKADFVNSKGAILVDDFTNNLDYWKEKGGIPIKFAEDTKLCHHKVITDLLELLELDIKVRE